jgi:ABC-type dipeptide/oligopeptide/nickel transport system ATPase component
MGKNDSGNVLELTGLRTQFFTESGVFRAVDGIDLVVKRGEVPGLVGESGCGKSVTSLSIMRLLGQPGRIVEGEIIFDKRNLVELSRADMGEICGNRISMIFQQPQSSLNPVICIGEQLSEVLHIHQDVGKEQGEMRAIELLGMVGIPQPEERAKAFPHELSGGMA